MRNKVLFILAALLLTFASIQPASASTWRSTSGNIFTFQGGGYMTGYLYGRQYSGRWWWIQNNHKFAYTFGNGTITVTMTGNGAVTHYPGTHSQYWTLMSSRGAADDSKHADTTSWFTKTVAP